MLQGTLLQPSRKHYGGLGYAKASCFLDVDDPDFGDKFRVLWDEHIPGFSGKVCIPQSSSLAFQPSCHVIVLSRCHARCAHSTLISNEVQYH
jgi:hypothetical protein